jgi:predicted HTH transcriptional regulator
MHYLQKLIAQGEGEQLDFKKTVQDSRKIARSMVAFANTRGGKLLIGVRDNGTLAGIESDEEAHMIEAAALVFCRPPVEFQLQTHRLEGKNILEVNIPPALSQLHFAQNEERKWEILIRDKDECRVAGKEFAEIFKLKQKKEGNLLKLGTAENKILELLRSNPNGLSVKQGSKSAKIPMWKSAKILTRLAATGVIEYDALAGLFYSR